MKTKLFLAVTAILIGVVIYVSYQKGYPTRLGLWFDSIKSNQASNVFLKNKPVYKEKDFKPEKGSGNFQEAHPSINKLPEEVRSAIKVLSSTKWDEKREESWQGNLNLLRKNSAEFVPAIATALKNTPIENSWSRFQMVFLLGEIGSEKAFVPLKEVVDETIPEILLQDTERESDPQATYFAVKTGALTAIAEIAKQSNNLDRAREILTSSLNSPYRSVRRQAVMSLKQLFPQDTSVKEMIFSRLPTNEHYMYDLKNSERPRSLSSK